ncbi:hypothetical protein K9M74_03500 [Candidatus Woesearchaeota archaeon]|nr:hypothetical protein [Candidatus Woesearchaeota archaeon]
MKPEDKKEVEQAFATMKEEFELEKSFEEYEEIFFLYDMVAQDGFVASSFHRQVSSRIANTFNSWYNHLHSIILPSQGSIVSMTEGSMFDEVEKKSMQTLSNSIIAFIAQNSVIALTKDKEAQKEFLDGAIDFWHKIHPQLLTMVKKVHAGWEEYSKEQ